MISRRHIRIKGMQALYANISSHDQYDTQIALKDYYNNIQQSKNLLATILVLAKGICEYALIDANTKGSKFLPTEADLTLSTKIAQNIIIGQLSTNESFQSFIKTNGIHEGNHADFIRNNYFLLVEKECYKNYIANSDHTPEQDSTIFLEIIAQITKLEEPVTVNQEEEPIIPEHYLEDACGNFLADADSISAWFEKYNTKIGTANFAELLGKEKRTFGEELIDTFIEKSSITAEIIKPKLINWDAERIAMMDRLILQLGITELLYFPNIPTKVTINEYIDIAKLFSTPQSGQFVNGVLDKIHKELLKENKIHKTDFKMKKKNDA
jgi:transcription antitermination protein NusB